MKQTEKWEEFNSDDIVEQILVDEPDVLITACEKIKSNKRKKSCVSVNKFIRK